MNRFTHAQGNNREGNNRGFTLIEVLVSVSMFAIVMLVATGSVFSIVEANKKTHSLKSVMTNLNFALESMMRDIRVGYRYSCGTGGDCSTNPGVQFTYKANRDVDGDGSYSASDNNDQIEYSLVSERIQKRIYGTNPSTYLITAEEIHITSMKFYVIGTGTNDGKQPKAVISISGYAGSGTSESTFSIQTTVSQRALDL
jgi:prepilin-type N-terminal cleavage/methylation domain-containing protein